MAHPTIQVRADAETREAVALRGGPEYIRRLIAQRVAEVDEALVVLMAAGWDRHHIRQACHALDGVQHADPVFGGGLWSGLGLAVEDAAIGPDGRITGRPSNRTAIELHDAARLGRVDVDADRWGLLLDGIRTRPDLVLALRMLARDWWSMDGAHPVIDAEDGQT